MADASPPGSARGGRGTLPLLALLVVGLRLPSLSEPRWYADEGTFTTAAWLLGRGHRLYADVFDNSPPGIYWIYRALLALGGERHHAVIQAALLLAVLASVLLTFEVVRGLDPRLAAPTAVVCAVALSLPTLDGDLLNVEVAALPFFLAALVLARRGGILAAVASGALLAPALVIRPTYALDGLAVALLLLLTARPARSLLLAAAGGLLVLGAVALVLAIQGSWPAYLARVLPDNRAYLLAANGGNLLPLAIRLALLAAVAALWYRRVARSPWRLLAVWLPATLAAASMTPRGLTHYVLEAVPALAVGVTALADRITARADRIARGPGLAPRSGWLTGAAALAALLLACEALLALPAQETAVLTGGRAALLVAHNFSYPDLPGYYGRWLAGRFDSLSGFPGPIRQEVDEARLIAGTPEVPPGRLLVLGDRAWIYFLAARDPAAPYVALNSAFRLLPDGPADLRAALASHRARVVVLADAPPGDWPRTLRADGYREVATAPYPVFVAPAGG